MHQGNGQMRVGVGGRKKNVLLRSALRDNRGRNAAEGDVTGLDDGDRGLCGAGVVDVGESEDRNYTGGVNGGCRRGRPGRWRLRWGGTAACRSDRTTGL